MIINGDCLIKLKELADNSIDSVVTDPPYGLKFMGKKWDYDVPSVDIWKEALRVLKPGGHCLSFGGTRTYHRMVVNIEDAGFEIRDQIQWLYGSGFPKSHNLKDEWKGWGTALKPANEPICMARKPLEKGLTVAENVAKWGCGAINVDGSRIESGERPKMIRTETVVTANAMSGKSTGATSSGEMTNQGRWPANVIFDEEAAAMLDEQSGITKSGGKTGGETRKDKVIIFGNDTGEHAHTTFGDSGGASRFFYVAKASKRERNAGLEGMPAKPAGVMDDDSYVWPKNGDGSPRNKKVEPRANNHPTVKPIKLMEYLIKLVTPPNGIVLDPFMGSGSTGVAAKNLGFEFIGIEMNEEYFEIAQKRMGA